MHGFICSRGVLQGLRDSPCPRPLCPRTMASYGFFAITFFSDINFFFKFYSEKRRTKGLKLCEKKDRSPCSFRRKQSLIDWANVSSKETFLVRAVRALVRALMTQEIMRST